jgi:Eukaryotic and archaeal DNA primase, large subunit
MDEDTRLEPILGNLSQGFIAGIGSAWSTSEDSGEGLRAEMVDDLAHKHFPMCMRNLHENLKRSHHLKHFGRLQYQLFLKVASICYWKARRASYNVLLHRFWVCLSRKLWHSGASLSTNTQTTNSTRSTSIISGTHTVWKADEQTTRQKGVAPLVCGNKFMLISESGQLPTNPDE